MKKADLLQRLEKKINPKERKQGSINIPIETHQALKAFARKHDIPISKVVDELVRAFLKEKS